ncbi:SHOCT domain-containing protein [Jiangella alba]|uniref:Short C-terminal domain-containing protein n=1 Tax=Jiangella alba TaxID=561176 RepID=A0A1H5PY53_9ACTN|nr:SHOCT domain-containing protein [Jiangella alba]SEF18629.1 hypothetical protein SAMN04488561_6695 [Jiangella alba]
MAEPSSRSYSDEARNGGPSTALRLVDRGEDARVFSGDPDDFLETPSVPLAVLGFLALTVLSVVGVRFITIALWTDDPVLPWFWNVAWLLVPWVVLGPLWAWFIRWQLRRRKIRRGREAMATIASGTDPEHGRAVWVSYPTGDPTSWRSVTVLVVAEAPGGEVIFVDARSRSRPGHGLFTIGDPVWIWRGSDGWAFGQVARHGHDPTHSPADEPRIPTFEELNGGRSPAFFATELAELAAQYRSGSLTRDEYETAKDRLLGI